MNEAWKKNREAIWYSTLGLDSEKLNQLEKLEALRSQTIQSIMDSKKMRNENADKYELHRKIAHEKQRFEEQLSQLMGKEAYSRYSHERLRVIKESLPPDTEYVDNWNQLFELPQGSQTKPSPIKHSLLF